MEKLWLGADSLWEPGTKLRPLTLAILLMAILPISSCTSTSKKNNESDELLDEDMGGEDNEMMDPEFPHPSQVSASSTKQLLITHEQPSAQSLDSCRANLISSGNNAASVPSLSEASEKFDTLIAESPGLYHWCFYQLLSQLDEKMADPKLELTQKYQTFVNEVKILFILAQALDTKLTPPLYCQYLKLRYIDMSKIHFGRRLSIVQNSGCGLNSDNILTSR